MKNRSIMGSLVNTPNFSATYDGTLSLIIDYLEGKRLDFPKDAVRCLFLLTDEDLDIHRQGITAVQLIVDTFGYCSTDEQAEEIERLINECKI